MKKILPYLAALATVIIITLFIFLEPLSNYYLHKRVQDIMAKNPSLSIDSTHFSPYKRQLFIHRLAFKNRSKGLVIEDLDINIKGINYIKLLLNDEVVIDSFKLQKPEVEIVAKIFDKKNGNDKTILNKVKGIRINVLHLQNAWTKYRDSGSQLRAEAEDLNLKIHGLEYNSNSSHINFDSFNGSILNTELQSREQIETRIKDIVFDHRNISLYKTIYRNKVDQKQQETAITVNADSIKVKYDFESIKNYVLKIPLIQFYSFEMKAYMDKRLPTKASNMMLISEMIHSIKKPFKIDSIQLQNGRIQYEERIKDSPNAGKVYFTNFNATISNITNDSLSIASNKNLVINSNCLLMNKGKLNTIIKVDLNKDNQYQHINGSLSSMSLKALNPTFLPLAFIEFEGGQLDQLDFNFYLNDVESEGNVQFYYHDLKIIIKNRKIFKRPKVLSKIETFLANTFLFRSDNPKNGNFKAGKIAFKRDTTKSVFNYWWKSLFSGMSYTILNDPTQ